MSLGNWEGEGDEEAEPEELPDWNAVSSLRETGRHDYFYVYFLCLFAGDARRLFICMVCVRLFVRFSLLSQYSDHVGLLETECECGYVPYLDIVSMVYVWVVFSQRRGCQ